MVDNPNEVVNAVVPAAGLGTRFLPLTRIVPKELLPLGNRPCVDYVVTEAAGAGLNDILFVTRPGKEAILEYFQPDPELEEIVSGAPQEENLRALRSRIEGVSIDEVNQVNPAGLGHAVAQAADHVGDKPFAVLLPDDLVPENEDLLAQMVAVRNELGGSVIAAIRVTPEEATAYGSIGYEPASLPGIREGNLIRVTELVEKPPLEDVLSEYAVAGRYVLDPAVFDVLETIPPGRGGEVQLTDALAELARMDPSAGGGLHAVVYEGPRYDTGTPLGYLSAHLQIALDDPESKQNVEDLMRSLLESSN